MTSTKRGQTKILLLGCNFVTEGGYDRSDTIIIVSIDNSTGGVKLASILRDIRVDLPGHGTDKINMALPLGGPEFALRIINDTFHQDIRYYALVDMYGLVRIIDLIGGIDVEITEMERIFLNCWVRDLAVQFRDGVIPPPIGKAGLVHMDGRTALSHARNRALGSDFARTDRQRTVLKAMAKKIQEESTPLQRVNLLLKSMKYLKTNLSAAKAAEIGIQVMKSGMPAITSIHIPAENTYTVSEEGDWHFEIDFEENIGKLEEFFAG